MGLSMGFFDEIKDLFVDEVIEDEEVEVEEPASKKIYEEPKNELPKVMRETISKTEKKEETPNLDFSFDELKGAKPKKEFVPEEKTKEPVPTTQPKFSFPIDLEEDYKPLKRNNVNILELEKEKKVEPPKEMPPDVPTLMKVSAPIFTNSSIAIEALGPPIPVDVTETLTPSK